MVNFRRNELEPITKKGEVKFEESFKSEEQFFNNLIVSKFIHLAKNFPLP